MTHFLDTLPFDWTRPESRELRDLLANTYYKEAPVVELAQQAGISPATVAWNQPMTLVWHDLLEEARNQDKLRTLVQQLAAGPTAVAGRVAELVSAQPVIEAPKSGGPARDWAGFDDRDALERQIFDEPSLLDVAFLVRGLELAPAVCRLLVRLPTGRFYGTAFRIGADLLLTNHHVLFDQKAGDAPATDVEAWFGYENDVLGRQLAHEVVSGRPDTIVGAKDHDWAVVRVGSPLPANAPVIDLTIPGPVGVDDRVYIIQHPNGGVKKIGMHHNIVRFVDDDVVQYWTDTEAGSSGSPVFDEQWRLVALHHRWVEDKHDGAQEYRNQGRRISRVVEGLAAAGVM
ncbi:MAG: trypsin-like peptidase domain-containing protein [Jiangellaceae bacterium]